MREEGLLKLFFADVLPPEDAVATLRAMREARLELAARLRGDGTDDAWRRTPSR